MLAAVQTGKIDTILAWHPDRLHRSPVELEEFITLVEKHGVTVHTAQAGQWDLVAPRAGRLVARQLGCCREIRESSTSRQGSRERLSRAATMGRPHGRRAYGCRREYEPDGTLD